jgi:hypothetical protein
MDYIQVAGIILAIWAVVRNIGNERGIQLREMEIRLKEEAARNPPTDGHEASQRFPKQIRL